MYPNTFKDHSVDWLQSHKNRYIHLYFHKIVDFPMKITIKLLFFDPFFTINTPFAQVKLQRPPQRPSLQRQAEGEVQRCSHEKSAGRMGRSSKSHCHSMKDCLVKNGIPRS